MTEEEVKAILVGIGACWSELTPGEVKSLLRILAAHGTPPTCSACGKPIYDFKEFSWDHILARSQGGPNDIRNMTPMHVCCNVAKGSKIDEAYFEHIEPELRKQIEPTCKGKPRKKTEKHYEESRKRRNHIRIKGWTDNSGHRGGR